MVSVRLLAAERDFKALWFAALASEFGSRLTTFATPLVLYAMSGSAITAAFSEACYLLGLIMGLIPGGIFADRSDRLRVMRASMAVGAGVFAGVSIAAIAGSLTVTHLLVASLIAGALVGIFTPAEASAIRRIVEMQEIPVALSQQQSRQYVIQIFGGPVGGLLLGLTRWLPFVADTVSYILGWLLLGRVHADLSAEDVHEPGSGRLEVLQGFRFALRNPFLRVLMIWSPLFNIAFNALLFVVIIDLYAKATPSWQIGLVYAVLGVAGIVGSAISPTLVAWLPTGRLTSIASWAFVVLSIPMTFRNDPVTAAISLSVGMLLMPAANAGLAAYRFSITPRELVGRTEAAVQTVAMASMPLAPIAGGVMLEAFGGSGAIAASCVALALAALIPTISVAIRSIPRPQDWPSEDEREPIGDDPRASKAPDLT